MQHSDIDLFPTTRINNLEAGDSKVSISFDSYSQNISISSTDRASTLNIRLDQDKMMRAFVYSLGNVSIKYYEAKKKFLHDVLKEVTTKLVGAYEEGTPERNQLEKFLVDTFSKKENTNKWKINFKSR